MFGDTKSDEELIALSKSASGTSRQDFFTEGIMKLTGTEKPDGTKYKQEEIESLLSWGKNNLHRRRHYRGYEKQRHET